MSKKVNYRFYAIKRNVSTSIDKDVQVDILVPNMLELMTNWVDWRKEVETKMTNREISLTNDKIYHLMVKADAVQHLDVIKAALESNDPVKHVLANLPYLAGLSSTNLKLAKSLAEYLMDQKLNAIRKLDLAKINKELGDSNKKLADLNNDLADISKVVLKELDKLQQFYKPRILQA